MAGIKEDRCPSDHAVSTQTLETLYYSVDADATPRRYVGKVRTGVPLEVAYYPDIRFVELHTVVQFKGGTHFKDARSIRHFWLLAVQNGDIADNVDEG